MPVQDFRTVAFDISKVEASGKDIGRNLYHKLFVVENLVRVIIHSVLSVQIAPTWWTTASDLNIQNKATKFRNNYMKKPWHGSPGAHDIYYVDLSDLNEIIRANSNLFQPLIPDIDQWIARIEQIRLPRNIVAHMNWPTKTDRQRIDVFYADVQHLIAGVGAQVPLLIP